MSLLKKPVSQISQLTIDVDRDWAGMGLTRVAELATGMAVGEMLYHDGSRLVKLTPGPIGTQLMTHEGGQEPTWEYPP